MTTHYTVTYQFNGYLLGEYKEAISPIRQTVTQLQDDGVDIEFEGATQSINAAGQLVAVTARYEAPSKDAIGRLNCRARLPASGPPEPEESWGSESPSDHWPTEATVEGSEAPNTDSPR